MVSKDRSWVRWVGYRSDLVSASKRGVLEGLEIPPEMFPRHYWGWPHQW